MISTQKHHTSLPLTVHWSRKQRGKFTANRVRKYSPLQGGSANTSRTQQDLEDTLPIPSLTISAHLSLRQTSPENWGMVAACGVLPFLLGSPLLHSSLPPAPQQDSLFQTVKRNGDGRENSSQLTSFEGSQAMNSSLDSSKILQC